MKKEYQHLETIKIDASKRIFHTTVSVTISHIVYCRKQAF